MSRTMKQRRDTRIVACQLSNVTVVQLNRPQSVVIVKRCHIPYSITVYALTARL